MLGNVDRKGFALQRFGSYQLSLYKNGMGPRMTECLKCEPVEHTCCEIRFVKYPLRGTKGSAPNYIILICCRYSLNYDSVSYKMRT